MYQSRVEIPPYVTNCLTPMGKTAYRRTPHRVNLLRNGDVEHLGNKRYSIRTVFDSNKDLQQRRSKATRTVLVPVTGTHQSRLGSWMNGGISETIGNMVFEVRLHKLENRPPCSGLRPGSLPSASSATFGPGLVRQPRRGQAGLVSLSNDSTV